MLCAARRLCRAQRRQGSPSDRVPRQAPQSALVQNHANGDRRDGTGRARSHGYGIRTVQKVRLMHAAVRHGLHHVENLKWDELFFGVPINQEDLAGTLLTFSFLSIDGLRKLGANISSEAAKLTSIHGAGSAGCLGCGRK